MTWETKLGLLVGMGVIILIGILISDHLSQAQRQQQARLDRSLPELEEDPLPPPIDPQDREAPRADASGSGSSNPLPSAERRSETAPAGRADAGNPEPPKPDTIRQDLRPERAYQTGPSEDEPSQPASSTPPETANADGSDQPLPEGFVRVDGPGAQSGSDSNGNSSSTTDAPGGSTTSEQTGPSDEAESEPERESEPEQIIHHVNKGETLSDVARQYYDDPNYWRTIFEANRSRIPSPGKVQPGVRLVIPNKSGQANTPDQGQASAASSNSDSNPTRTYKVQRGDSLSEIAEQFYGSSGAWRKLHRLNKDRIEDPDSMKPGIVLRVPSR